MVAAGDGGTVIKTTNGGINWIPLISGTAENLKKIRIIETSYFEYGYFTYYFAVGSNGKVITSSNLGLTWENRYVPVSVNLNSICFETVNTGFACGSGGTLIETISNHFYVDKKRMNANSIGTWFRNDGGLNRNSDSVIAGFEFPRGSGHTCRYISGLTIGAIVGGDEITDIPMTTIIGASGSI